MTALPANALCPLPRLATRVVRPWLPSALVLLGLAGIVGARWLATTRGLDGLAVGAAFGVGLVALWLFVNRGGPTGRGGRTVWVGAAAGVSIGLGLVALTVIGAFLGGAPLVTGLSRPAAAFLPWALITIVVAAGEEGILRGALFDRLRAAGGVLPAVLVTTVVFAIMHVPLYGWHVVPLDLAVGLCLAGLRLATRTIIAPVAAHAVADLATWWL